MREPCPLPLVALAAHETCPRCGRPAREHRGHPAYEEETMTETTEPTRERIEATIRQCDEHFSIAFYSYENGSGATTANLRAICAMALRTLDAEAQLDHARRRIDAFTARDNASDETIAVLTRQLAAMTERAEKAEANYRFMVERAADERLDGYRELGARAAAAEERAEKAERECTEAWDVHGMAVARAEKDEAQLAAMHRRAQRAESATAAARREAIGQRKRADWWRIEAKRLGWTPTIQPVAAERLDALVEAARHVEMSPEQREAQRRSFAHGNVAIENPSVTREHIDVAADRLDCESSSLLLLSTWARRVMMREKNRDKGVPTQNILDLLGMARHELSEARWAIAGDAPIDDVLAELGDAAAIIGFAMREIEKRRKA